MKIVFVHIPKTGGASINYWFQTNAPGIVVKSKNSHDFLDAYPDNYDFSFTIVRNTYYRLISLYNFSKITAPYKLQRRIKKNNITPNQISMQTKSIEISKKGIIPWLEFCLEENLTSTSSLLMWTKNVDYILQQENLAVDFQKIQKLINCYANLEKKFHVLNYNPIQYLDKKFKDFVYENWKEEINYFGYKV